MKNFYENITNIFNMNLISYTLLLQKKNKSNCTNKMYKYYKKLVKQYRILGILPFKINKFIKLNNNDKKSKFIQKNIK